MLYGIGLILLLVSASVVGGSAIVPMAIAFIGIALMGFGRRTDNGTEKNPKR